MIYKEGYFNTLYQYPPGWTVEKCKRFKQPVTLPRLKVAASRIRVSPLCRGIIGSVAPRNGLVCLLPRCTLVRNARGDVALHSEGLCLPGHPKQERNVLPAPERCHTSIACTV
jgi:hypothetical protein